MTTYKKALEDLLGKAADRFTYKEQNGWIGWEQLNEDACFYRVIEKIQDYRKTKDDKDLADIVNFVVFIHAKDTHHT